MKNMDKLIASLVKTFELPVEKAGKRKGKNSGLTNLFWKGGRK